MSGVRDKTVFGFLKNKSNKKDRSVHIDRSHKDNSLEPSQEPKDYKPKRTTPERRESGRLHSAARILGSLGRGGDEAHKSRGKENVSTGIDRKNPQYHSEGKGLRKKSLNNETAGGSSKERSRSFCEKETQRRIPLDNFARESPILESSSATNSPKVDRSREALGKSQHLSEVSNHYQPSMHGPNSENIYEHVSIPGEDAPEPGITRKVEPILPALVPTVSQSFEREKERRSTRKLTKDSGYETSPYSEGDYANLELVGEDLSRPHAAEEFRLISSVSVVQTCAPTTADQVHPTNKTDQSYCCLSSESRTNSETLNESPFSTTAPALYSESITSGLSAGRSRSPLPKFNSIESLKHLPDYLNTDSEDTSSLVPARSTPSLCQLTIPARIPCKGDKNGSRLLSSISTPNLEARKNDMMVTNRSLMHPFGHKRDHSPSRQGHLLPREMHYDRDLSQKVFAGHQDYGNHLRSSSYQGVHPRQSYHSRQHSNASVYSDETLQNDLSLSQRHNVSVGHSDKNGLCPVDPEASYFPQCGHSDQEMGYVPHLEPSYYTSSKLKYIHTDPRNTTDYNITADKYPVSSSKLQLSPPPPPVRDISSLKYVRYGPGHEKFPSWPVPAGAASQVLPSQHLHDATFSVIPDPSIIGLPQGCHRSHSWTEQSDYPKNTSGAYTRPYMKNHFNPNFQSQLITVMENCEKIPPEMFHPKQSEELFDSHGDIPIQSYYPENVVYCPPYDREGRPIDDKDYNIPSPPERDPGMDINLCHFTSAQLEEHARLYDLNYAEFPHVTPFLDQLRQESYSWDENSERDSGRGESESVPDSSRYGRESVTTVVTNSSSASSSETLKWQGSFSDISVVSGNSRDAKRDPNVAHSSKVKTPQRQNSESVLYYETEAGGKHPVSDHLVSREKYRNYRDMESGYVRSNKDVKYLREYVDNEDCNTNLKKFPSYSYSQALSQISESPSAESSEDSKLSFRCVKSPTIDFSKPPSVADRINELEKQSRNTTNMDETRSPANITESREIPLHFGDTRRPSFSSKGVNLIQNGSEQILSSSRRDHNPINSRALKLPSRSLSMSGRDMDEFPMPSDKYSSSGNDRRLPINSAYTYLDPNKKCMVSDSTLKNIQKRALLSFYERKTGKGSNNASYPEPPSHSINRNNGKLSAPSTRSEDHCHSNENMARIGKVPIDIEASPLSQFDNAFTNCQQDNIFDDPTPNSVSDHSLSLPSAMPEIHSNQVMTSLSSTLNNLNDLNCNTTAIELATGDESREHYSIAHSPSSSNQQIRLENTTNAVTLHDTSPRPPERPPKNPSLRSSASKSKLTLDDTLSETNNDYKNVQRKPYYYNKPPAPDPPPSPPEDQPPSPPLDDPLPSPKLLNITKNATSRASTPDLPPPPPPPLNEEPAIACDEPLPPPPSEISFETLLQETICEEQAPPEDQKAYHKDSYMAHRKDWTTGFEGRYRRTHSPSAPSPRNQQLTRPRDHESSMNIRNLQRSSKALSSSNSDSTQLRSSVSTSNLSPVCSVNSETDTINNNSLCQTSRNLAQSADWSSHHNTSITVTFSSEELKAFKAKKASLQLSAFRKYNAKDSRHHHHQPDVGGSVQSLASSSEASQSSTNPSDESRLSFSWKTSLDSLNRPASGMSEFSCHARPISRAISIGEPLHHLGPEPVRSNNLAEPLNIITTTSSKYNENNTSNSSPIRLSRLPPDEESIISHDGAVTAHPATVTEDTSQPASPVSPRDRMNATSTPKVSPDNSPKSTPASYVPISPTARARLFAQTSPLRPSPPSSSVPNSTSISPNNSFVDSSGMSNQRLLSPTGTSCTMAAQPISEGQAIDRSNIVTLTYGRTISKEELDYDKQSMEFVSCTNSDKQLKTILAPGKDNKTIASYLQDLFSLEFRQDLLSPSHLKHPDLRICGGLLAIGMEKNTNNIRSSLPTETSYIGVSDCKARLLAKVKASSPLGTQPLSGGKDGLIKSLTSKVQFLREEQCKVKMETTANNDLGLRVTDLIQGRAKTAEFNRFKSHAEEIDKIISLLLVLSGRLAKAENALSHLREKSSVEEKKTLEGKRDKLKDQLDEAMKLKESIDRRAIQVSKFLMPYLNESEFAEYDHYVKMKAKLIMDTRDIDDKLKLGEEQLQALQTATLAS